jgi:nitrite reductase/ring-hydroxylating ferredoxin subunit
MAEDPQTRYRNANSLDPRLDSEAREGLTGTSPADLYHRTFDADAVTLAPDSAPADQQPSWRQDFPIDWPEDQYVARRDFAKFLVLTSGALAAGQVWIAARHLVRKNHALPPRLWIASLRDVPVGSALMFGYPEPHSRCLLIRPDEQTLVAYSQSCTHLSCAVVPRVKEGVLHCPCHEGYFDLRTGRNIAGPPPRPLPKINLEIDGDNVYAIGVEESVG